MLGDGDGDGALQGTPAAEFSPIGCDELIPGVIFSWQKFSEDDCKLKTNRREPRIIYLRTFCRFCLGSGFSLALVDCICTGNKINVTPAPVNLSLSFSSHPPPPLKNLPKEIEKEGEELDHVSD